MDLLELLRGSELLSVDGIAERLGVGRRTVFRDLATLRERGHPILADAGPGGGVMLDRHRGVAAVHLSTEQMASLWLHAQLATLHGSLPFGAATRGALDKLLAALPAEQRRSLNALIKRVIVGRPATPAVVSGLSSVSPALLPVIEQGLLQHRALAFDYLDRHGERSRRRVQPHGLLVEAPVWYVLAWDLEKQGARMFRMDRIAKPRLLNTEAFVPDIDALHRKWREQLRERH